MRQRYLIAAIRAKAEMQEYASEALMTTALTNNTRHSTACAQCGKTLIAAEWFEHMSDGLVHYLWWCDDCGNKFETAVKCPVGAEMTMSEEDWKQMFPPLLVA